MVQKKENTCKISAISDAQAYHGGKGQLISQKTSGFFILGTAYLFGGGGMLAWLVFICAGPIFSWDIGLKKDSGRLLLDTALCLLFFIQHSFMIRRGFRVRLTRWVRAEFHGALYATVSGFFLLLLTGLWQPVGSPLWVPVEWMRWTLYAIILLTLFASWWGMRSLGHFDALGVKSARQMINHGKPMPASPFVIRGPYRWVRHPLYLSALILTWVSPFFTIDRLLYNTLSSIWIIIGAAMEEKDLVACLGNGYRDYQKIVPMLLPRGLSPRLPESAGTKGSPSKKPF